MRDAMLPKSARKLLAEVVGAARQAGMAKADLEAMRREGERLLRWQARLGVPAEVQSLILVIADDGSARLGVRGFRNGETGVCFPSPALTSADIGGTVH